MIVKSLSLSVTCLICIAGGSEIGKETQCARLTQDLNFQHLSVENLLREEIDRPGSNFATFIRESMQSSVIISAQLTVNLLKAKMNISTNTTGKKRYLIDEYSRSMDQALTFERKVRYSYCYDPSYAPSLVAMLMTMLVAILRTIADRSPLGHRLVPKPTIFRVSLCSSESYRFNVRGQHKASHMGVM